MPRRCGISAGSAAAVAAAAGQFLLLPIIVVANIGIATAIAVTVLSRVEFAVFATAYFLAQVPILLAAAVVFRCFWVADGKQNRRS